MTKELISKDALILMALSAYRNGEISEGRCVDLTGWGRDKIRDEMYKRIGKYNPYDEAMREAEGWKRKYESLLNAVAGWGALAREAKSAAMEEGMETT